MKKNVNFCYLDNLRYCSNNFNILSKEDFFRIYDFDINKPFF